MSSMGVDVLTSNLTNPQRLYMWEVLIPNVVGGAGNPSVLQARAQSTSLPGSSVGEILIPYKKTSGVKYPGKLT